jgi:BolA protein
VSIQQDLEKQLRAALAPLYLQLENESHMHGGGAARDPGHVRESHFRAVIVSDQFAGKRLIQQHQQVYRSLGDLMQEIHALALHTYTPEEWSRREGIAPPSPPCPKAG